MASSASAVGPTLHVRSAKSSSTESVQARQCGVIIDLQLVDLRASVLIMKGNCTSGTLAHATSVKNNLELVLPVALLVGDELMIGLFFLLLLVTSSMCNNVLAASLWLAPYRRFRPNEIVRGVRIPILGWGYFFGRI